MLTTILMETYDAQMLDSGDADIHMYPGTSASEPWLSVEASMTDEAFRTDPQSFNQYHSSIEVDMEDHDGEITEYEMADEAESYRDTDAELLDVDVYDASRIASPRPHATAPNSPNVATTDVDASSTGVEASSLAIPDFDIDGGESAQVLPHPLSEEDHAIEPDVSTPILEPEPSKASSSRVDLTDEMPESAVAQLTDVTELSIPLPEDNTTSAVSDIGDIAHHVSDQGHLTILDRRVEDGARDQQGEYEIQGSGLSAVTHAVDSPHISSAVAISLPSDLMESGTVNPEAIESPEQENLVTHDTAPGDRQDETEVPGVDTDEGTNDPHEISEGVYIDPPPAVLMSLSLLSEISEYCLFNQPVSTPGSQSPSSDSVATVRQPPTLLLHHRPTLYYEPLSTLFEALRQEACIQSTPELVDAELVLDAYDLQLVIAEDNVHVHEVTLHDLNVLHDGVDLFGPLRLRLQASSPRFISRYNALRDQIARLDLAAGDDKNLNDENLPYGQYEQGEDLDEQDDAQATVETSPTDGIQQADANVFKAGSFAGGYVNDPDAEGENEAGDPSLLNNARGVEAYGEEKADSDNPEECDETHEGGDRENTNLDAGEVHRYADTIESGEYVDEYPEDDDEGFGDVQLRDDTQAAYNNRDVFEDDLCSLEDPSGQHDEHTENASGTATPRLSAEFRAHSEGLLTAETSDVHAGTLSDEVVATDISSLEKGLADFEEHLPERPTDITSNVEDDLEHKLNESIEDQPADVGAFVHIGQTDLPHAVDGVNCEDLEDFTDFDEGLVPISDSNSNSRKTSTTLPNKSSKRGHDEIDSDDGVDSWYDGSQPSSPGSKRLRIE
ncbi:hypothetical protein AcV5_005969 [Taiwanofungus camphoratus]|nr:hypothetical protein AcV5_005969 [Antrodia cinnamomea]KAI0933971.1 hypothetical protein AcV5_005969 [Antrodia cinnamomea]